MSRPTTVTYEILAAAAHELEKEGQRVTSSTLRAKVGGANSTIIEFLRQWRAEKELASRTDEDMSDAFRQSLLAEFGRIAQKTKVTLEKQLTDEKANTEEALELLAETEKRATTLEETIAALKQEHEATSSAFEKKTAALDARLADSMVREAELTKKLETTLHKFHQSEIEAAVLKSRCEALEKQHATKDKKA